MLLLFNHLNSGGNYVYRHGYILGPPVYLCIPCDSYNKQQLQSNPVITKSVYADTSFIASDILWYQPIPHR
jgi:hypothetical protein